MEKAVETKRDYKKYIHVVVMLLIIAIAHYIPPTGGLTQLGVETLGIFVAIVYGWSTLGFIMPSMIGILAFGFLGENDLVTTLTTAFGDRLTVIVLMFFFVSTLAEKVGLCDFIAQWCITRPFVAGRPWAIAIMFFIAGGLISALVNTYAAMFLMWSIFLSFCHQIGYKAGDKYPMLVLMGILYFCSLSGALFPYMGLAVLVVNQLQSYLGLTINYLFYTIIQFILNVFSVTAYVLVCKYIFKPDVSCILESHQTVITGKNLEPLNRHQKLVSALIVLLILILFLPELLPSTVPLMEFFSGLDIAGVAMFILILYYILMLGHKDVVPITELAKGLSWDLIFMFAAIAALSAAINNPDAGILTFVHQNLSNFLTGMSPAIFVFAIFIISSVITQFANNAVVMSVIGPIMFTLGDIVGADPYMLTVIAAPFLSVAFMTPAASVPAALAFSSKDWIGTKNAYCMGAVIFIINVLMMLVAIPLSGIFF